MTLGTLKKVAEEDRSKKSINAHSTTNLSVRMV
jgi:hypothetical protein